MTQIMGTALAAPPELARGAEVAIATAWVTPRTAEAGTSDVCRLCGGQCIGVAEDGRLNRHQEEEPGAGGQQRGIESEYSHGQGRDGDGGEGEPEPDQGARLEPAADDLGVEDREQDLGQGGGGEEQRERQGAPGSAHLQK